MQAIGNNTQSKILKPKKGLSGRTKRNIFIILMLTYPVLHFAVFWGYVNIETIIMTFRGEYINVDEFIREIRFVGWSNYQMVFNRIGTDALTQRRLVNSLLYLPVNSLIILPVSLIFSYFLFKKVPLSNIFRVIFFLPSILPIVVLTMSFSFTFDPNMGPIDSILKMLFGADFIPPSWFAPSLNPNSQISTSQVMIYIYCIWAGFGGNIVLINGAISRIPTEIIEYGKIEGISWWREFIFVVIPMIWPTIATTFMLGCTAVFTIMMQPLMLTPENPYTNTIALFVYNSVERQENIYYAATFGVVVSLIGAPIILLIRKFMLSRYPDVDY